MAVMQGSWMHTWTASPASPPPDPPVTPAALRARTQEEIPPALRHAEERPGSYIRRLEAVFHWRPGPLTPDW